jgi:hypothetical protein
MYITTSPSPLTFNLPLKKRDMKKEKYRGRLGNT